MEGPLFSSCFPIPIRMSSFRLEVVNHLSITCTSALSFCGSAHMKFTGSFLPVSQHMMHGLLLLHPQLLQTPLVSGLASLIFLCTRTLPPEAPKSFPLRWLPFPTLEGGSHSCAKRSTISSHSLPQVAQCSQLIRLISVWRGMYPGAQCQVAPTQVPCAHIRIH